MWTSACFLLHPVSCYDLLPNLCMTLMQGKYDVKPRINFTDSLPAGLTYDVAAGVIPVGSSPQGGSSRVNCMWRY